MDTVFVCYRRTDGDVVRRIKDALVDSLGEENVFLDVDAIRFGYGHDFRNVIRETIRMVATVVVVIGQGDWVKRLNEPNDVVALEIEEALGQGNFILPVLVDSATMPRSTDLPSKIADIAFRSAVTVHSGFDFEEDIKQLLLGIHMEMAQRKLKRDGWTFVRFPDGTTWAV